MESVGQELRRERLLAGLTLDQVRSQTRISLKNLHAIENDDLEQISSPFFYKSFVRQFAECLNIDFIRLAEAVQSAADTMPKPLMPGQGIPPQTADNLQRLPAIRANARKNSRWLYSIASFAIMLVGCSTLYAIWQSAKSDWHRSVQTLVRSIRPEPKTQAIVKRKAAPQIVQAPKPASHQTQMEPVHTPVTDVANDADSDDDSSVQSKADAAISADAQAQATSPPADSEGMFHIELSAIERTWISIVDDGKETFNGILDVAETKAFEGHQTARVKTGNAGGLNLVFNGKFIGAVGRRGQVRTVIFTKENYEILEPSAHISLTHFNSGFE